MFGAHMPELIIVLVVALIAFGPKRLPEIGGSLGKGIRDFRKSVSGLDEHGESGDMRLPDPHVHEVPRVHPPEAS